MSAKTTDERPYDLDARYGEQVVWRACVNMVAVAMEVYDEISSFQFGVFQYRQWYR